MLDGTAFRSTLAIELLNVFTGPAFEMLTVARFRSRLHDLLTSDVIAVGVSVDGRPIGLGLAELSVRDRRGNILSLFVAESYRHRGIGTDLLKRLEGELRNQGCAALEMVYSSGHSWTTPLERILERDGWWGPEVRHLICIGKQRDLAPPWLRRRSALAGFEIVSWSAITEQDRKILLADQERQPWYPQTLTPLMDEQTVDQATSLCLRHHGEIAGWLISQRVTANTIGCRSLFVRTELRHHGCGLRLAAEAIHRQSIHHGPDSFFTFAASVNNAPMMRFAHRLEPYLAAMRETRVARKHLLD